MIRVLNMECFANLLVTSKIEKCLMSDMIVKWDLWIFPYTLAISVMCPQEIRIQFTT